MRRRRSYSYSASISTVVALTTIALMAIVTDGEYFILLVLNPPSIILVRNKAITQFLGGMATGRKKNITFLSFPRNREIEEKERVVDRFRRRKTKDSKLLLLHKISSCNYKSEEPPGNILANLFPAIPRYRANSVLACWLGTWVNWDSLS